MLLVLDNTVMHVVDYPAQDGIEVIDKRLARGVFMRAEAAERFRNDLRDFVASDPDIEAFDDFLESYDELMNQQAIYH